jgi:hypothetical protein
MCQWFDNVDGLKTGFIIIAQCRTLDLEEPSLSTLAQETHIENECKLDIGPLISVIHISPIKVF